MKTEFSLNSYANASGTRPMRALTLYGALAATTTHPAFAQFQKATAALTQVQTWLLSIGAVVVTLAIMMVGFRMMFGAAQWKDVAPVFWGGIFVGGASAISALFF